MAKRPDEFLPNLAASLNNLGGRYSEMEMWDDALVATQHAVKLYKELVAKRPDEFLPNLAASLNNLGNRYSELGKLEEALGARERAVGLWEELAAKRPDDCLPQLATSLAVRSQVHGRLGHGVLALHDIVAAVAHLWSYFERQPSAFAHLMGMMLSAYIGYLDGAEPDEVMAERLRRYKELIA